MTMTPNVRLRSITIPPEHGAWGFLFEPILLGLLVAPSAAGVSLAVGVVGGFLARHPLKIALVDRQRGKRYARTRLAERVALIYSLVALVGVLGAVVLAGPKILVPLLLAVPLGAIVLISYLQNRARDLVPESAGALALALTAPSLAIAAEEPLTLALALWAILAARTVPSILYVRARLRLERGQPFARWQAVGSHAVALAVIVALAAAGLAPWLAAMAILALLARASWGLSPSRKRVRAQTIGFLEIGYGLMTVLLAALGYALLD